MITKLHHVKSLRIALVSPSFRAAGGELHAFECLRHWLRDTSGIFYIVQDANSDNVSFGESVKSARLYIKRRPREFGNPILRTLVNIMACLQIPSRLDVVISTSHYPFDFIPALLIAVRNKCALVLYLHHMFPSPFSTYRLRGFLIATILWMSQSLVLLLASKRADLVLSPEIHEVRRWLPNVNLAPLRNGVFKPTFPADEKTTPKHQGCFIGRISKTKGIEDLLQIWKRVTLVIPDAKLAIIGTASRRSAFELSQAIIRLGLQRNVDFFAKAGDSIKFDILVKSSCFLFPSYEEGWGIAITEALACGVPVVAYDLPAYKPFRDAIIVVPLGDKGAFSARVTDLLENRELRSKMITKGLQVSKELDWDSIARNEWTLVMSQVHHDAESR